LPDFEHIPKGSLGLLSGQEGEKRLPGAASADDEEHTITLYAPRFSSIRVIECSPPSWAVVLTLGEKLLTYSARALAFDKGEHRTPEMLARNPRGTIPVLMDGALVVHETFAILEYLDFAYPEVPLLPLERATRALAITRFHESSNLKALGMSLFSYLRKTLQEERSADTIQSHVKELYRELDFWEAYYGESVWCAGAEMTLGDISVFVYLATAVQLGLKLDDKRYPNLYGFYGRMRARPAVRQTWPRGWKGTEGIAGPLSGVQ